MRLGTDFIIAGLAIIVALTPFYIFRKQIFKSYYDNQDITTFINDIKLFLKDNFTKISFSYEIVQNIRDEEDSKIKQTLIIEDLVSQFVNHRYTLHTQRPVNKSFLWTTYEQDSIAKKGKAPLDLKRRKELAWKRDNEKCNRCGKNTKVVDTHIKHVKDIEKGGTYHFENLTLLCSDCYRLLNSKTGNTPKDLKIQDYLFNRTIF